MKYNVIHPPVVEQFATTDLVDFSKMEARCSESLEPLRAGDKILVVFSAQVQEDNDYLCPIRIPLTEPTLVKQEYFEQFSQRLLDSFVSQPSSGSVSHSIE